MDRSDVAEYVERSASLVESSPQMNEENTKAKLIRPLIELLGWDVYSGDVELEYSMQIGRGNTRADYALLLEGTPVVFVEAKGCDTALSDAARSQLKSYMRQTGVDWGLLTNGRTFEILKRRTDSKRPDEVTMGTPSLEELTTEYELLELLSKDLVESGEADTIAERMEATRRAVERLRSDKERISERVTQVVADEIGDVPPQEIQPVSKEYIDGLIDSLEADRRPVAGSERENQPQAETASERSEHKNQTPTELYPEDSQYVATLYNGETTLQSFTAEKQSILMRDIVDVLVTEHGLIDELGPLPYVPGRKNAVLNSKPKHPSGDEMRTYGKLSDGTFLDTNMSFRRKQRTIQVFADECGLSVEFGEH